LPEKAVLGQKIPLTKNLSRKITRFLVSKIRPATGVTECVVSHTLTNFFVCVHLNFRKSLTEIPRNGCGTMRAAAVTWQSPISPQMFLQTGLGRASTRHLSQPAVGGDWGLSRYNRRPHRTTGSGGGDLRRGVRASRVAPGILLIELQNAATRRNTL